MIGYIVYLIGSLLFATVVYSLGYDAGRNRKFHVKYVENCSAMQRKTFNTRLEAAKWVANFKLKHQGSRIEPDCWVDMVFQGDVIFDEGDPK